MEKGLLSNNLIAVLSIFKWLLIFFHGGNPIWLWKKLNLLVVVSLTLINNIDDQLYTNQY